MSGIASPCCPAPPSPRPRGEVRSWLLEAPRVGAPDLAAGMGHATGGVTGLAAGAGYLGIGVDAFPSGSSGRAARRASSGRAISPHGSPLISDAGQSPGRAGRAMISMQAWGQTAEAPAVRPGNRSGPTGGDPK